MYVTGMVINEMVENEMVKNEMVKNEMVLVGFVLLLGWLRGAFRGLLGRCGILLGFFWGSVRGGTRCHPPTWGVAPGVTLRLVDFVLLLGWLRVALKGRRGGHVNVFVNVVRSFRVT